LTYGELRVGDAGKTLAKLNSEGLWDLEGQTYTDIVFVETPA
jgi:hypothetical protein